MKNISWVSIKFLSFDFDCKNECVGWKICRTGRWLNMKFLRVSLVSILCALVLLCPLERQSFANSFVIRKVLSELKPYRLKQLRGYLSRIGNSAASMSLADDIASGQEIPLALREQIHSLDDVSYILNMIDDIEVERQIDNNTLYGQVISQFDKFWTWLWYPIFGEAMREE